MILTHDPLTEVDEVTMLKEKYPKLRIDELIQQLQETGWNSVIKYPKVKARVVEGLCRTADKAIQATEYRASSMTKLSPINLDETLRLMFERQAKEIGLQNIDGPRVELNIGVFNYDSPGIAETFRQSGIPIPADVSDLKTWVRSFEQAQEPVNANDEGLWDKPFRNATGDLFGVSTPINGVQLEISGAENGPGTPFLRVSRPLMGKLCWNNIGSREGSTCEFTKIYFS